RFNPPGERDEAAVRDALSRVDLTARADRPLDQLSGGERQRAFLARALAQAAPALLLDEPTASLDLSHQLETLELLRDLARGGDAVLLTLHDLGLAGRYADRLVVLSGGRRVASGPPAEVLTTGLLRDHFRVSAEVARDAAGTFRVTPLAALPK
ncbi:MAG: ABC transporter ATP-binding protein, partial [Deltaproteobacteria bacterium]|nr:ABC transporter ATP-binding protein [Deltaproteobacteria bacterium]